MSKYFFTSALTCHNSVTVICSYNFISRSLLPDVLFPCPTPFFSHLPFFCCPFSPSNSRGAFFDHNPLQQHFHQALCKGQATTVRKVSLPLSLLSILSAGDNKRALQRQDLTHNSHKLAFLHVHLSKPLRLCHLNVSP